MKLLKTWGTLEATVFMAQEIRHLSAEKLEMENYLGTQLELFGGADGSI